MSSYPLLRGVLVLIVLVGLLGKLFGPIGFLDAAIRGRLPWIAGLVNITNDLIWLVPFVFVLVYARRVYVAEVTSGR